MIVAKSYYSNQELKYLSISSCDRKRKETFLAGWNKVFGHEFTRERKVEC